MSNEKVKLLVVEDDILVAQDISSRLIDKNYAVVGIAATAGEALQFLANNTVDLILLDIILKGSRDGIELARIINKDFKIPFIFLTSHADSYFIERAKSVKPHAYILKPFNDRQLMVAIELALLNFAEKKSEQHLLKTSTFPASENQVLHIKDSLFLKKNHHFERVPLEDILFLKAENNYTSIHTKSKKFMYSVVLKKIEAQLPKHLFTRIHRTFVVNIQLVSGFEGNTLFIQGQKLPVSKSHKDQVFQLFRTI